MITDSLVQALGTSIMRKLGDNPIQALRAASVNELVGTYRLTQKQAERTAAVLELSQRVANEPLKRGKKFLASRDVFRHFGPLMRDLTQEEIHVVLVDGKHRIIKTVMITRGTLTSSPCHPRSLFREAIVSSAAAIVMVHNHPSGDPTPSGDDFEITKRIFDAGDLLGIQLLDHIIIGDSEYVSLADRGLMHASS